MRAGHARSQVSTVCRARYISHATAAAIGIVRTQAATMLRATPHRTADSLRVAPTPMIDDVIVWVVETGAAKTNAVA